MFFKHLWMLKKNKQLAFDGKAPNTAWYIAGMCPFAINQPTKLQSYLNMALLAVLTSFSSAPC